MSRAWALVHVLSGWLPVWALYAALIAVVHDLPPLRAARLATLAVVPAALLGILVYRFARRFPWPRPFRLRFALLHVAAAPTYAVLWILTFALIQAAIHGHYDLAAGPGFFPFFALGIWLYVMIAGISYAIEATERAARAETTAARTQLAALRAQLHPHFLFNALHSVVQLIPVDPERAQEAAEQVAGLLRTTVEEDRDIVTLAEEWAFVSRYVELERLRFGDRLAVRAELDDAVMSASVPSFALQTLVENAVRHGAAPRVEPTAIVVTATGTPDRLLLTVRDDGDGLREPAANGRGTGLERLRERLVALYGDASRLEIETHPGAGWAARLVIPRTQSASE